jgi:hypothetical protein
VFNYITAKSAARKWKISIRRVQLLCSQGRVEGAIKHGSVWAIPKEAMQPNRLKSGKKEV